MRLIDADALIERLKPYINKYGGESFPYDIVHDAFIYEIEHAPTVDAVPVIRCEDCIYYKWEIDMCNELHSTAHNVVHEDDYCSRAERRKTDNEK